LNKKYRRKIVKGGMDVVLGVGENGAVMTWAGVEWLPLFRRAWAKRLGFRCRYSEDGRFFPLALILVRILLNVARIDSIMLTAGRSGNCGMRDRNFIL
jgi:hypothetical protein